MMAVAASPESLDVQTQTVSPSRRRLVSFRAALVFAGLLPAVWGGNAVASAIGGGPHLFHDLIGSGIVLAALWLATIVLTWSYRRRPEALATYLVVVAAATVATALSASNIVVAVVLIVQAALVTWAHPARAQALRGQVSVSRPLAGLALVQIIPLAWYAFAEARLQATGDPHAELAHYFDQAWVALAVAALVLLAAVRPDLRALAARLGGSALAVFGAASLALPDAVSSPGSVWGAAALLAGVTTAVVTPRLTLHRR